MNHKNRAESFERNLDICRQIWSTKGIEYANSDEDANANFYSEEEIGVDALKSCSIFMNKHYRSIRSYIKNGEVKSNESIQGRLHDLIVYSLIMLSLIEEKDGKTNL
jgi:hypothetical protein